MTIRWVQTEQEQAELGLEHVQECYWRNRDGFWFNDETHADVCGPFPSFEDCQKACAAYAYLL